LEEEEETYQRRRQMTAEETDKLKYKGNIPVGRDR
jgi:hypothetical protein